MIETVAVDLEGYPEEKNNQVAYLSGLLPSHYTVRLNNEGQLVVDVPDPEYDGVDELTEVFNNRGIRAYIYHVMPDSYKNVCQCGTRLVLADPTDRYGLMKCPVCEKQT